MEKRTCVLCGLTIDPSSRTVWRRVQGWERKGVAGSRRGGSDISCRERVDEYACNACIVLKQGGHSINQEALL